MGRKKTGKRRGRSGRGRGRRRRGKRRGQAGILSVELQGVNKAGLSWCSPHLNHYPVDG